MKIHDAIKLYSASMQALSQFVIEKRTYLASSKFQGSCNNYIACHEVEAMLLELQDLHDWAADSAMMQDYAPQSRKAILQAR